MNLQRSPWIASELMQRPEHRMGFVDGIGDEINDWIQRCPEVVEDDVSMDDVAGMKCLTELASRVRVELTSGSGVARVSPPTVAEYDDQFLRRYYLAFGVLLGDPLGNYGRLYEVKDRGGDYTKTAIPVSQTRAATGLHTDSSAIDVLPDMVGLICIRAASEGGSSRIACAIRAYLRLQETDHHSLSILENSHLRDIVTPGADQSQRLRNQFPVFRSDPDQGLICRYMRFWIEKGYEKAEVAFPEGLENALDSLDHCLEEEESVADFRLQRGEMLWVDNCTTLHDRTEYVDDPEAPRLLLRQWVKHTK
ncbi:MAG: TauD/TfdA family dioxygenase [Planctomycetota bacterium]|nr:TauD/TfdA family dioxygenase [Planctomycetota bacterium]